MAILPATDLRCEYLKDPLGVDVVRPRLSWRVSHLERDQVQSAYRIIVSSTPETAEAHVGDLWDSQKVLASDSIHVVYSGKELHAFQVCYWQVQWWDKEDRISSWSAVASFEMGMLAESEWLSMWISMKECKEFRTPGSTLLGEPQGDHINAFGLYLRKEFTIQGAIVRARACVCGLGYYELRINGRKVGDRVLDPAQTDYHHRALYSTYDITDDIVRSMRGTAQRSFAVGMILGNGRHIKSYGYDHPKAALQIMIEGQNAFVETLCTDATWKVSYGPLQENGLYYGERYDARIQMRGWDEVDFDDTDWENAIEVSGPKLSSQLMPPIRVENTIRAKKTHSLSDGRSIFDFGQNIAGWVRIAVKGSGGTEIRLRHAELLHDDGTLNVSPNQKAAATDVFVLSGFGTETYEPRFTYHGFRYVEITGSPELPFIESVEACFVHTDVERRGRFSCSSDLINRIHQNILWGQLANLMSIPADCPQRDERQGWLGDAHLSAEEAMFNFEMASFYTKFLKDIQLAQKPDGSLPDTVPPYLGRLYPADPAWSSAYITIAWYMYQMYGDTGALEEHFESMKRYIAFLTEHSEKHIIRTLGKYGDWCPPGSIAPKRTPVELTSTWYYYHDVVLLSRIASALQREQDAADFVALASEISVAFNETFLNGDEYLVNRFAPVDRSAGQTSNALPLFLEMVPPLTREGVLKKLLHSIVEEQDYHLDTGILGTRYLLDVLTANDRADIAYRIASQRSYPGWGYMIGEGATTIWERWEKIAGGGMNSHNHIMFGSVDAWFYRAVAGISCLAPGWKMISFKPCVVDKLESAEASFQSVRGEAAISWNRSAEEFRMRVLIPVGSTALISVPILWELQSISETTRVLWSSAAAVDWGDGSIRCRGREKKFVQFECGSGDYQFTVKPVP